MFPAPRLLDISDYGEWQTEPQDGGSGQCAHKWESQSGLDREILTRNCCIFIVRVTVQWVRVYSINTCIRRA